MLRHRQLTDIVARQRLFAVPVRFAAVWAVLSLVASAPCLAAPGSGTAEMWPNTDAVAGTYGQWTIRYTAAEDFGGDGGTVAIDIPEGWSAPQLSDSTVEGFVRATLSGLFDPDSLVIVDRTIRLHIGSLPQSFSNGDFVEVIYGGSYSLARAQTTAPDSASFVVKSDPDGDSPQALTSGSPKISVLPGPSSRVVVFFAGSEAGEIGFTADQNSNVFTAKGFDDYDNPTGGVSCTWSVTGEIGELVGGKDSTITLDADKTGTGYIIAEDDFAHVDSTGLVTVTNGAYTRLDVAQADTAVAGEDFSVAAAALDADGNIVTTGVGSDDVLTLTAWSDSVGSVPGTGSLFIATMDLSQGQGSIDEKYFVAESIYIRAVDDADTTIRDFGPTPTVVTPGSPSVLVVIPDSLFLVAGTQGTFLFTSLDSFGNVSPVSSPQTLQLATSSVSGEFREVGGVDEIFEKVMAEDSSQVSFDYYDIGAGEFQITVTDVDTNTPAFPTVTTYASIRYSVEDTLIVSSVSDPVVSGTSSDVVVEVRDRFGNRVPDYDGTIEFSSSDGNPETVLPPDYTFVL
ncbi:MAG: hypothetical protein NTX17_09035, partial [Candidatus Eisenbacteria bacterium]|nr:hypothetical protein [Candidatus Eisenbacteria bacterium]